MFDRWYYELQLMGKKVLLTPLLLMAIFFFLALLLNYLKIDPTRAMLGGQEMLLTVTIGILVGNIATSDAAIELQLTLPQRYDWTALLRILIIFGWIICVALASSGLLVLCKLFFEPQALTNQPGAFWILQLSWLAPLCWFMGVGLCLSLLLRSWVVSAALIAGIFIAEIVLKDFLLASNWLRPFSLFPTTLILFSHANVSLQLIDSYWLDSRLEALASGVVLLIVGWLLLRNTEGLLKSASEE
ncbi:MAG TPA: hypothetical protein VGN34_25645 [Ktedonobacteraceae bacterium]|jgi:hypothetical protein